MIIKIISFKKVKKRFKKSDEQKHNLDWLTCGSDIQVTESGTNTPFLVGEVIKIIEQKTSAIPKQIDIKVKKCNDDIKLVNTIIELEFVQAKTGKKPIFKLNRMSKKIFHNSYVITNKKGIAA
jgi:hypothetical protein